MTNKENITIQSIAEGFGELQKVYLNGRGTHKQDEKQFNEVLDVINQKSGDIERFSIMRIDGAVKLFVVTN